MVFTWTSFFIGSLAGLSLVAVVWAIVARKLAPLAIAMVALLAVGTVLLLSVDRGGDLIDIRAGVVIKGERATRAAGLHWGYAAAGAVLAAALSLVHWRVSSRTSADGRAAIRQLPWVALWTIAGIFGCIVLSERVQIEQVSRRAAGLHNVALNPEAYKNRVMPQRVPVLPESAFSVETVLDGLDMPASLAFLPDGSLLIGEVGGRILVRKPGATAPKELYKLKGLEKRGETGLLDIELDPSFPEQPYLYVYYTLAGYGGNRLTRFRYQDDRLDQEKVIVDGLPAGHFHNGGSLTFGLDGMLYFSLGEANYKSVGNHYVYPEGPQGWSDHRCKIFRIKPDGTTPDDNPKVKSPIYAIGMREVFRMAVDPLTARIFFSENGSDSHDEINVLMPGGNYGHPLAIGVHGNPEYEEPVLDIPKPVGITGLAFYDAKVYPEEYRNDLFFGTWNTGSMYWLPLDRDTTRRLPRASTVEIRPKDPNQGCYLDIKQGPDGLLYYSNQHGIYRLRITKHVPEAELQRQEVVVSVDGREIYTRYCAACHQLHGQGREGMFPPLAGSRTLTGNPRVPATVILSGVQSKSNPQANMPAFGDAYTDQQIAAVLSYVRTQWGNKATSVSAATVGEVRRQFAARIRQAKGERGRALTVKEIAELIEGRD